MFQKTPRSTKLQYKWKFQNVNYVDLLRYFTYLIRRWNELLCAPPLNLFASCHHACHVENLLARSGPNGISRHPTTDKDQTNCRSHCQELGYVLELLKLPFLGISVCTAPNTATQQFRCCASRILERWDLGACSEHRALTFNTNESFYDSFRTSGGFFVPCRC